MRIISTAAVTSAFAQSTNEAWYFLLKLVSTGSVPFTKRYVNNWEDVASGGNTFTAWPFAVSALPDEEGKISAVTLTIDNVDQALILLLRQQTEPIAATVQLALSGTPSTIEAEYDYSVRQLRYNATAIEAALAYEALQDETFPKHSFDPTYYPGIFGPVQNPAYRQTTETARAVGGPAYIAHRAPPED